MYIEGPRDVPDRLAFGEQLRRNLSLIRIEFARPAEAHATLFCRIPSGARSLANQIPLELGNAGENRHDHLSGVSCREIFAAPHLYSLRQLPGLLQISHGTVRRSIGIQRNFRGRPLIAHGLAQERLSGRNVPPSTEIESTVLPALSTAR